MEQSDFDDENNNHLTNTVFVIKYEFVLTEDVTLGSGCVLEFEGGSISGTQTLTGNNTGIKADLVKIFDTATTLAGTWDINIAHLSWFLNTSDYNASINKAMSLGHRLDFDDMEVYITAPIIQSVPLQNGTIRIADSVVTPLEKVIDISAYGSKISNLSIYGGSKAEIGIYGNQHQQMGLISDVYINNCTDYGLKLENCYIGSYNRIIVNNCGIGIYVHQAHNARVTRCEFTGCNKGVVIDSGADVLIDGLDTSASQVCDIEMIYPMSSFSVCNWYTENFAGDYILHIGNIGTVNFQNCFVNCNGHKFIKLLKNYNNTELGSLIFDSIRVTYCAAAIERESDAIISSLVFNGFIENADQSALLIPYADFIRTTTYNGIRYSRDKMIYEDIFVDSNWFGDSEYIATQDIKAESHKYMRGFNVFPTYKRGDQITVVDRVSNVGFITKAKVFIGDVEYILVANDNTLVYSNIPQDYVVSNAGGQSFVMLNQTLDETGVLCIVETLSVRKPS